MSARYEKVKSELRRHPRTWLVTGVAGFIGSNLLESLLVLGQRVVGLDNFATGSRRNLDEVRGEVGRLAWSRFHFIEGDVRHARTCNESCTDVDIVLHQAALGSVPRSINDPVGTHQSNVDGFVNMLVAAKDAGVGRFVYASSSSVYGDHPDLPKQEDRIGQPLSPYALTKAVGEQYAAMFSRTYGLHSVGLRYFNVFGPRQSPAGPYAAVLPRWASSLLRGQSCTINGDGETSRDFCYVANAVQANLLAGTTREPSALDQVYNIACGRRTSLKTLYRLLRTRLAGLDPTIASMAATYAPFRKGDVRHSRANISKARRLLGFKPTHSVADGLDEALSWYVELARDASRAKEGVA